MANPRSGPDRRSFVRAGTSALLGAALWRPPAPGDGRLRARPARRGSGAEAGTHALGLAEGRDGWWHVPASLAAGRPAPLVVALHGATLESRRELDRWRDTCEARGFLLLAPDSRGRTWDIAEQGGFGPDVAFIDRALAMIFGRCAVDASRCWLTGFSDGASYALSLGLVNGDLFGRIAAFSPGFIVPGEWTGQPKVFVSHGRSDPILPIEVAGRRVVTMLQRGGYSVRFREFDGGHQVPPAILGEAVDWLLEA